MKSISLFGWMTGTLRKRLIFSVALVHAVLMTIFVIDVSLRQSKLLMERQTGQAISLANALSVSSAGWLTSSDVSGLQELVDAQRQYPEFKFSMILNLKGEVLAHTDRAKLGKVVIDIPNGQPEMVIKQSREIVDVTSPVMLAGKHVGWTRVGISQSDAQIKLKEIAHSGIIYAVVAILIGSMLSWFMGSRFTIRLKMIQDVIDKVRGGILSHRVHLSGDDEAANLANGFNQMLTSLEERNQELRQSDLRWQFAIEGAGDGLWDWNLITNEIYFSSQWKAILGYSNDDIDAHFEEWESRIHFLDRNSFNMELNKYLVGETNSFQNEHRILCKDGSYKWVMTRGKAIEKNTNGLPIRIIGIQHDIDERKRIEDIQSFLAKTGSESKNKPFFIELSRYLAYSLGMDFVFVETLSAEGKLKRLAAAMKEDYLESDQVYTTGRYLYEELINKKLCCYPNNVCKVFPDDNSLRKLQAESYSGILLSDSKGNPLGLISVIGRKTLASPQIVETTLTMISHRADREIERLNAEEEQEKLRAQLIKIQKMESIGNLAGGIAHDFNNILFPIVGMAELLLEDLPRESMEYENAKEILKAGRRGADLVKQILTFSRQTEHKKVPTRVSSVLKEVLKLSRSTIPSYIDITQDIQSNNGLIMADPTQIHQIALNIITNAYHAVETNGGEISVGLMETELEIYDLPDSNLNPGKYLVLSISDTGQGIQPEHIDKIFDPYFTTKEQGKGTGLGLAVVHGIVQEHRGAIKVYSEIGKGSTFNIYLPLIEKTDASEADEFNEIHPVGNESILVVDDEEAIANIEKQMLDRLGYKVSVRYSSADALKAFQSDPNSFDIVITDMTMPKKTGVQLARDLIAVRPDIPIIICTGFSEGINQNKAATIGVKGFLLKPIVKSDLAKMVRKVLDETKTIT